MPNATGVPARRLRARHRSLVLLADPPASPVVHIPPDTGDFRLLDHARRTRCGMREHHRFMRGLSAWSASARKGAYERRSARRRDKYPLRKMVRFALDAITGFSLCRCSWRQRRFRAVRARACWASGRPAVRLITPISRRRHHADPGASSSAASGSSSWGSSAIPRRIYDEVRSRPLYIVRDVLEGEGEAGI